MATLTLPPALIPLLLALPVHPVWVDHDEKADVLYLSFRKPQQANDSIMQEPDMLYHYHDQELVGITVLNASAKSGGAQT